MKIEIKRLSVNHRLSEETLNFACDVWVDGKKVGEATNHGTGGPTNVHLPRELRDAVAAHAVAFLADRPDVVRYTADSPCVLDGKAKVGDPVGDPTEYMIDTMVHEEDERRIVEKERKRTAKYDAEMKADFAAKGMRTLRWTRTSPRQTESRWFGVPEGKTPAEVAEYATKKYAKSAPPAEITWEVLS